MRFYMLAFYLKSSRARIPGPGIVLGLCALVFFVWIFGARPAHCQSARSLYLKAGNCRLDLMKSPKKQKYRDRWLACINGYLKVYKHDPNGPWAAAGLYEAGILYKKMYGLSKRHSDKTEAVDLFYRIIKRFPKSAYRKKAENALARINTLQSLKKRTKKKVLPKVVEPEKARAPAVKKPTAAPIPKKPAQAAIKKIAPATPPLVNNVSGMALVTGLRFWSSPSYTRVVIDADKDFTYVHHLLKKDPAIGKPQRLFVDMKNARVSKGMKKAVTIQDDLLSGVRAAQYSNDTVRVVVDIKSFESYKVFSLRNPFRVVIDLRGEKKEAKARPYKKPAKGEKVPKGALARQFALGVSTIVIDPGHGGKDYGAPGNIKGVHEKRVVLQLAKKLAKKLRAQTSCKVILTRDNDRFLTLEERTAIANTKSADLFISIHTNAHPVKGAYGIETYLLNLATDEESIRVAAMENQTSAKNISDLQSILNELMQNAKKDESRRLAYVVQNELCCGLKKKYSRIRDKGVKEAPFYVLLGADMPAILVETGFISNKRECKRLIDPAYQELLVQGIVNGIKKYVKQLAPAVSWAKEAKPASG